MLFVGMLTGTWPYQVLMGSIKPMAGEWGLVALMGMAIGIAAAGNATGRIVWGMTLDRLGYLRTHRLAQILAVAATLLMLTAGRSGPVFVLCAVLIGACYGSNFAIFPATVAKLYGVEHIGAVYSWIMTAQAIAALGAMLNGFLRDLTGSYLPGLATTVAMAIAGLIACAILARPPRPEQ
jgi:MFS family permease